MTIDGVSVGRIDRGLVLLIGIEVGDGDLQLEWMARKVANLRIFDDEPESPERSLAEVGGAVLAVSQFTVAGDCRKGRRPSYDRAMPANAAAPLFERFVALLRREVATVATGRFGASMQVHLVNDGPFTLVVDTNREVGAERETKV